MKENRNDSSLAVGQNKEQKGVFVEAQRDKKKVHFATLMDSSHVKNAELEPNFQKYKGRSRTPSLRSSLLNKPRLCDNWRQQKWMSLQDYHTVMDKQRTPYQHTLRMLTDCSEFHCQRVQIDGNVFHDTSGPNHGPTLKIPWYWLNDFFFTDTRLLEPNWECLVVHRKQGLFFTWMILKKAGKKQNTASMWKKWMKNVDIDGPTSFLDHVCLGCTQRECKPNEIIIELHTKMFESRIAALGWQKRHAQTLAWSSDMEGHGAKKMRRATLWTGKQENRATL